MKHTVFVRETELRQPNLREILRYAGCKDGSGGMEELAQSCVTEAAELFEGRVCWLETPVTATNGRVEFSFGGVSSDALCKALTGCDRAVIFAATVGLGIDRLIAKYGVLSPSRALMLQAFGAERIESLCDSFCEFLKEKHGAIRPRFSPGYGDLPLEFQREIFAALDCPRKIGLTLNESLLMSPTKSVTAIVGLRSE